MLSSYAVDKSVILFRPGDIIPLLGGRRAWNYDDLGPLPDRMEVQNLSDPKHLRFVARHQLLRARIANIFQASGTLPPLPNVTWVANKWFEISKFKFNFPRARTYEIIRLVLGCIEATFCK